MQGSFAGSKGLLDIYGSFAEMYSYIVFNTRVTWLLFMCVT